MLKNFNISGLIRAVDDFSKGYLWTRFIHKCPFIKPPKPGGCKSFRRIVNFPSEYTIEPLTVRNLGGRDPVTGRLAAKGIGGGIKHKYHWIKWFREGPTQGPPKKEKVLKIIKCGCRTAHVALVGCGSELKYILATQNMKVGDIIQTCGYIPKYPIQPNEGDAYPVGAFPIGSLINNLQLHPSSEVTVVHSAGSCAKIKQIIDNKVVIALPSKRDIAVEKTCMATMGRLSNIEHSSIPIGSAQNNRLLGNRPRSGLWQRKTGRFGHKIKKPKKVKVITAAKAKRVKAVQCDYSFFRADKSYFY